MTPAGRSLRNAVDRARSSVLRSRAILHLESGQDETPGEVSYEFGEVLKTLSQLEEVLTERVPEPLMHDVVQATGQVGYHEGRLQEAARRHLERLERPV